MLKGSDAEGDKNVAFKDHPYKNVQCYLIPPPLEASISNDVLPWQSKKYFKAILLPIKAPEKLSTRFGTTDSDLEASNSGDIGTQGSDSTFPIHQTGSGTA